jgi:excisionase family DNA binding protein
LENLNELSANSTATNANQNHHAADVNSLKLLSVSKSAKILGIRIENVNSLIQQGKIKVIHLGERMKIPFFELERFVKENLEVKQTNNSKVQINVGKPKFTSESNSFDSKALAQKIIGGKHGNSN